ncbi:phosphotransferase [Psychromonas hadalis]|uniref:phosphotransferase n=1 Tax=Psychromonas hadalis TaxID=211669 RepID=UPI0003B5813A|nr:phosphotransferase [Psychromonas hadalis]
MRQLPVSYSVTSANALLKEIIPQFKILNVLHCEFWCQGLNDSYKVITTSDTFLLRIYRHNWRTLEEIKFELDALLHVQKKGLYVAYPMVTHNGEYIVSINAPEGLRYAILTRYIQGKELKFNSTENAALYGKYMAQLHLASKQFSSEFQRFKLDVKHLITEPLQRIKPFLKERGDDWAFISNYAKTASLHLQQALNESQDLGFCHGDLHGGNAHYDGNKLAFFDFDCCGFGLRVYDLAVFKWALKQDKKEDEIWQAFLQRYLQYRPLNNNDLAMVDILVSIRQLWLMGLHIDIAIAKGWLDEHYFDQKIAFLREAQQTEKTLIKFNICGC